MTNRSLVFLSGEQTSIPEAEARALFLTYDPSAKFESPEPRVLIVESSADPSLISSRIAFARRVGRLLDQPSDASGIVAGKKVRLRAYSIDGQPQRASTESVLRGIEVRVDLAHPECEFTLVEGRRTYLALTNPSEMEQSWSARRPRRRTFFHPSAIFPKLSRALVNLSRCRRGGVLLDPFAGTGSIPIEASAVGALAVAMDQTGKMTVGSMANMKQFGQEWLGVVRADALSLPLREVDAVATDVPYGRASSTRGRTQDEVISGFIHALPDVLGHGARAVIMHSRASPIPREKDLALEEEHHLYVHKRLTRTISVLRRR